MLLNALAAVGNAVSSSDSPRARAHSIDYAFVSIAL